MWNLVATTTRRLPVPTGRTTAAVLQDGVRVMECLLIV